MSTKRLNKITAAWLAALIDGEGSIMCIRHSHGPSKNSSSKFKRHLSYRPRISIYNSRRKLLEAVVEKTGMGEIHLHIRRKGREIKSKDVYEWRITRDDCRKLIPKIMPWLILKDRQADALLDIIDIIEKRWPKKGQKWAHVEDREATNERLINLVALIKQLNKRGKAA